MDNFSDVIDFFPQEFREEIKNIANTSAIEEIRLYSEKHPVLLLGGQLIKLDSYIHRNEFEGILNRFIEYSYHTYEKTIASGFITLKGGHRVGLCGEVVEKDGKINMLRNISSMNIRHAREIKGIGATIVDNIVKNDEIKNTLIVSPPGCGKTTLLRDIVRLLCGKGIKVSICDERSEIAAMNKTVSSFDVGDFADVISGCAKNKALEMIIRSMSPDVVITDEISYERDLGALKHACNCGVALISTIHGKTMDDVRSFTSLFKVFVFLSSTPSAGTIKEVICF